MAAAMEPTTHKFKGAAGCLSALSRPRGGRRGLSIQLRGLFCLLLFQPRNQELMFQLKCHGTLSFLPNLVLLQSSQVLKFSPPPRPMLRSKRQRFFSLLARLRGRANEIMAVWRWVVLVSVHY